MTITLNNGADATGTQKRLRSRATQGLTSPTTCRGQRPGRWQEPNTCRGCPEPWNAANTVLATNLFVTTGGPKPDPGRLHLRAAAQYPQAGTYDAVTATLTVT